ncbi:MAG: hypothetical protein DHS20C18_24970 [Saprospiraceae bacterium]|nr:MAG: hypothetical protein DHS20C18_24970 [Saprospiraceae bacterium]
MVELFFNHKNAIFWPNTYFTVEMPNKNKYIQFCQTQSLPLQMQYWWLDLVCGLDNWDVALSIDKEDKINGALPYYLTQKWGQSIIKMPPFTDYIGPWIRLPISKKMKPDRIYSIENQIIRNLIDELPKTTLFTQQFYPDFENWLPFYWNNYRQTTYYTYVLNDLSDMDQVYHNLKGSVRTDIKKAQQLVFIEEGEDIDIMIRLYQLSFQRQGLVFMANTQVLKNLDQALQSRNQRKIFFAKDLKTNVVHAAVYLVWDNNRAYFLFSGADPVYKESAAINWLYWHAISAIAPQVDSIDFCGSILPNVEHVFRSYGAIRKPHFRIYKAKNKWVRLFALLFNKDY